MHCGEENHADNACKHGKDITCFSYGRFGHKEKPVENDCSRIQSSNSFSIFNHIRCIDCDSLSLPCSCILSDHTVPSNVNNQIILPTLSHEVHYNGVLCVYVFAYLFAVIMCCILLFSIDSNLSDTDIIDHENINNTDSELTTVQMSTKLSIVGTQKRD